MPEDAQDLVIGTAIRQFAESYGSRKGINDEILAECIELLIEHFGKIGVTEIRTAYQLWSMRVIEGAEMWGGEFNAQQLGRVLSDYVRYRHKVVMQIIEESHRIDREQKRRAFMDQKNEETKAAFPEDLQAAKEQYQKGEWSKEWRSVPGHWYSLAAYHGFLTLDDDFVLQDLDADEKADFWRKAKEAAQQELSVECQSLIASGRAQEARSRANEYKDSGVEFRRKALTITKKMIVYELLIKQ